MAVFRRNRPSDRPPSWLSPPGMIEAVTAEPTIIPYGYVEPDFGRGCLAVAARAWGS